MVLSRRNTLVMDVNPNSTVKRLTADVVSVLNYFTPTLQNRLVGQERRREKKDRLRWEEKGEEGQIK